MATKKKPAIFKKLTSSGTYRYYSRRTKKRISRQKYYASLRRAHTQRRTHKRQSKVTREKFDGKYAQGTNFNKSVNIMFRAHEPEEIIRKVEVIYLSIRKRFKTLKHAMYIGLEGFFLMPGGERIKKQFFTRRSFVEEYDKTYFRLEQIGEVVDHVYSLLANAEEFGLPEFTSTTPDIDEAEDFNLRKILIAQRNQTKPIK